MSLKNITLMDFPGGPVVKTPSSPKQGARVPSLVRELRSHVLHSAAKKTETHHASQRSQTQNKKRCMIPFT